VAADLLTFSKKFSPTNTPMKKQLTRISILQSSKIATALYFLMGFIYTLIGIPMAIFCSGHLRIIGIVYSFGPILFGVLGFVCLPSGWAESRLRLQPLKRPYNSPAQGRHNGAALRISVFAVNACDLLRRVSLPAATNIPTAPTAPHPAW
jgi:hypothetical protein